MATTLCAVPPLLAAAPADGASRLVIRGAGYGHGVGLSQYGAYGFAQRGRDHAFILRHYYRGTRLGETGGRPVNVLIQRAQRVTFSGASSAEGMRSLQPGASYSVTRAPSGKLTLRSPSGRKLDRTSDALVLRGSDGGIRLAGRSGHDVTDGSYRGDMELRAAPGGITVVNVLDLEDYVRGVVAGESPSNWPAAALRAQAVIARTYAVTTSKAGAGFEQFADTRSQVYNGISGEEAESNAAVDDTAGEIVTYKGEPVVTYYFSTSGGRTENVENSIIGGSPMPWLRSVTDPFDDAAPRHRWVKRMSLPAAGRRLGGAVKGSLQRIEVADRGRSPRVVRARVVGSEGTTGVGPGLLRDRLDLFDTWASFTSIVTGVRGGNRAFARAARPRADDQAPPAGGALPRLVRAPRRTFGTLYGRVAPVRANRWVAVQLRVGTRWRTQFEAPTGRGGRYRVRVTRPGLYRVQYRREPGPAVRVG